MDREQILNTIKETHRNVAPGVLTWAAFRRSSGVSARKLLSHFDSWNEACIAAGIQPSPSGAANLKPNPAISKDSCISELRRIASLLGKQVLTMDEFQKHAIISTRPIYRHFRSWPSALQAAGLNVSEKCFAVIPLADLAKEFLCTFESLGRVPTLRQLARRSQHGEYCFSGKFGGYATFKHKAIELLLAGSALSEVQRTALTGLMTSGSTTPAIPQDKQYHHGRTLNFRAFVYAPTYENEVINLFGAIADELGFEILCNRPAFPDCEARKRIPGHRKRFERCLIEFEVTSSDYRKHKHPFTGCDLIVCWKHDWDECPLPVLELESAIRNLKGWR